MKQSITLGIIHTSLGELQWLVPHFYLMRQKDPTSRFVLVFFSAELYQKAKTERIHLELLLEFGEVLTKNRLIWFILKNRNHIKSIYKDFWPIHRRSLAAAIRFCAPNATLFLYPHANALYSLENEQPEETQADKKHDAECFDFILLNTIHDVSYWKKRVNPESIRVIGSPAYSEVWIKRLIGNKSKEIQELEQKARGKKMVVVFTRPADGEFLDEPDYLYLLNAVLDETSALKDAYLIFKPHPREHVEFLKNELGKREVTDYCISEINPFMLSSIAHLTVNFWSSTITDSLSVGCPAIEFFRYHDRGNDKWLKNEDGTYQSFYSFLGLCLAAESRASFSAVLKQVYEDRESVLSVQRERFNSVFLVERPKDTMFPKRTTNSKPLISVRDWLQILLSSIKASYTG